MRKKSIALLLLIAAWLSGCARIGEVFDPYPTDAQMIEALNANRPNFEALVQMFQEDSSLRTVDSNGAGYSDDLAPVSVAAERKQRYFELMKGTGVRNISRYPPAAEDNTILLQVWWVRNGIFLFSKSKYYLYKNARQDRSVESLDAVYAEGRDANDTRRIDSDWSLYLDVW